VPNLSGSVPQVKFSHRLASQNLNLLIQLIRRDFSARFVGSAFGFAWAVIQPVSLVLLYWFVFTNLLPARDAVEGNYVLYLISGILPWLGLSEGVARGTTSIVENSAMVRRVPLQSEILVAVPNASAMIFQAIGIVLFTAFLAARGESMEYLWVLPFAMLLQFMLQTGAALLLAVFYVFFRDIGQIVGFLLSVAFFLSPILFSAEGRFRHIFMWNPMTPLLGLYRSAITAAPLPSIASIVFLLTVAVAFVGSGLLVFRRARASIVDLI
jgi:lipopolysaccharide transport system permease protein